MNERIDKTDHGNKDSFMHRIEEMTGHLYKTALLRLRNEQDARDAVQEALTKSYSNIHQLKNPQYFKSWLIRILLNECNNIKAYQRKVIPIDKEMLERAEYVHIDPIENIDLFRMVNQLNDIYMEIIDLRYNHDLKLEEISKILKIPVGTVKSRINTAHRMLRDQYLKEEASL